jgi:hypothetical protein
MRMIDKAVDYAKERKQFGRVIGSFQAVKHMCAEMIAELEPCRALIWYARYASTNLRPRAASSAAHAKAHTSESAPSSRAPQRRCMAAWASPISRPALLVQAHRLRPPGPRRPERARHDAAVAQAGWGISLARQAGDARQRYRCHPASDSTAPSVRDDGSLALMVEIGCI